MSHISVKVKLEGGKFPTSQLAECFGFVAVGQTMQHSDSIYRLSKGRLLKIRNYSYPEQPTEIVLERVAQENGARHSTISVGVMREGRRDSSPQDVLGKSSVTVDKRRRVFTIEEYPSIKVYADELSDGARYLEFQMDVDGTALATSVRDLKNIVASYGFRREDLIEQAYESLYEQSLFKEASNYTEAYADLPEDILSDIRQCARLKAKGETVLFEKNSEGQTALLITRGRAYVHEYGVTLQPGQLVGEFAAFGNGRRTASVVSSGDLEGYIIERLLLMRLMTEVPANAGKFLKWSQSQAALAPGNP